MYIFDKHALHFLQHSYEQCETRVQIIMWSLLTTCAVISN